MNLLRFFFPSFLSLLFFSQFAFSQIEGLFHNPVYSNYRRTGDIQYSSAYNYQYSKQENLLLDMYEPDNVTSYLRPVLVYAHPGGFTAGDKYNYNKVPDVCSYFAQRGWVTVSINYRLGIENVRSTTDNFEEVYEATQDAKAAVRFLRAHADEYCIDTSAIFMTGASAGGSLTLETAYWDQEEAGKFVDVTKLGLLETNDNSGYSSKVRAVVSCWGGVNDTSWLNNNNVPQYLFHGTNDPTVPYTSGYNNNNIYIYGSYDIHEAALRYGMESYLHPFYGFGHGIPDDSPQFDTLLILSNDFLYAHLPQSVLSQTICSRSSPVPEQSGITIRPTISSGDLTVNNGSSLNEFTGTFLLYSLSGQVVYSRIVTIGASSSISININSLEAGIYFAELKNKDQAFKQKIIIIP
ncbi:MAG: carboxylesterase family protein [Chitinophagales bacterium]|nr:carboxylesterase family protein [Chitinophagales bacterium]